MVIAVDASFLLQKHLKNYNNFIIECFNRLANNYPQHQFVYIYPKAIFKHSFEVKRNTFPLVISSSFSWRLSKYWWYTIKLPAVIKKHKADVLVSVYKQGVKNDKFSKCLIANDFFSKKEIVKDLRNADSIATSSVSIKTKVVNTYAIDEKKITVIYYAVSPLFKPVDWEEKELAKNKYASSIDYFLCLASFCTHENLITVLKAFSKFKQWQKSSMQLLLYSDGSISDEKFLKSLVTYKYKNDIKLVNAISLKEIALITASAYTVIYPASANDFYEPVIGVMQSGVPLITSPVNTIVEIAGEAALYADPDNVDDMAKHMITVYKDENKKKKMIADGLQYVQQYNFDNAAQLLWQSIVQAMGK